MAKARHEQRVNEREERDLVAQRQSALWAFVMAGAAVLGMGLSAVGVFLVWTTFNAAREGNTISERIGEAQTRAYLTVTGATVKVHGIPEIRFTVRNSGNSPARDFIPAYELTYLVFGGEDGREQFWSERTANPIRSRFLRTPKKLSLRWRYPAASTKTS